MPISTEFLNSLGELRKLGGDPAQHVADLLGMGMLFLI